MLQFHRHFAFPLNVYAHATFLEHGRVECLHYGIFDSPEQTMFEAQATHTKLLFEQLPPAPARVMDVGIGMGTTLLELRRAGYTAAGVTPDANQVKAAARMLAAAGVNDVELHVSKFEDLELAPASFDVVLFQESSQYIPYAFLLENCARIVKRGGRVIIFDEMAVTHPHHRGMSAEHGFATEELRDLTPKIMPTMDAMIDRIGKHSAQLQLELRVSEEKLGELLEILETRRDGYQSGQFQYLLLRLAHTPG